MTDKPEWVVPGAPVVLYSKGGAGTPRDVKRTRIAKVNQATTDDAIKLVIYEEPQIPTHEIFPKNAVGPKLNTMG